MSVAFALKPDPIFFVENEYIQPPEESVAPAEPVATLAAEEAFYPAELSEPRWAVVSAEDCAMYNLTYDEAVEWLEKLHGAGVTGLYIVTDETANRLLK
jgi:hypothetical protein